MLIFLLGLIMVVGAIFIPESRVRWSVILQNSLCILGVPVMFLGLVLELGVIANV
jgi:hypothetical protein